jgi:hypothetical protein
LLGDQKNEGDYSDGFAHIKNVSNSLFPSPLESTNSAHDMDSIPPSSNTFLRALHESTPSRSTTSRKNKGAKKLPRKSRKKAFEDELTEYLLEEEQGDLEMSDSSVSSSIHSDAPSAVSSNYEEMTIKERQAMINASHPFGMPLWKPSLYKKVRGITVTTEKELRSHVVSSLPNSLQESMGRVPLRSPNLSVHSRLRDQDRPTSGSLSNNAVTSPANQASSSFFVPFLSMGNIVWILLFGLPLFLKYITCSLVVFVLTLGTAKKHYTLLFKLGKYWLWPFGRDVYCAKARKHSRKTSWASNWSYHSTIYSASYIILIAPTQFVFGILNWALVYYVPMAKVLMITLSNLIQNPLNLSFDHVELFINPGIGINSTPSNREQGTNLFQGESPAYLPASNKAYDLDANTNSGTQINMDGVDSEDEAQQGLLTRSADEDPGYTDAELLICICRAGGLKFFKYTVAGINILFVNLIPFVLFVVLDGFIYDSLSYNPSLKFLMCMLSTIPLSYFIGMSVASISAQSSPAVGAVLNASFGSIIEVLLYCMALLKGKEELVEGSLIGTLLGCLLLLPGLSMIAGGVHHKQLAFNAKSAGVTNTMLIMSLIGAFTPTLFHQVFGTVSYSVDLLIDFCVRIHP